MSVKQIRKNLEDLGLMAIDQYRRMIKDPRCPVSTKAKICASILDRCGAPVLRATITKNATEKEWDSQDIVQMRETLVLKEAQIAEKIEKLESE